MSEMQRLTLFAFKPESVRRRLCQRLWFSELREPGAVVAEPGEAARQWWVILSGSVVAGEPPPDAQHSVDLSGMTHLTEGDSFGADSAVPTPRQVSRTVLSTGARHRAPGRQHGHGTLSITEPCKRTIAHWAHVVPSATSCMSRRQLPVTASHFAIATRVAIPAPSMGR